MKDVDKAYIAGLIDGEGAFFLFLEYFHKRKHLYPRLTITNTNKELLNYCKRIIGAGKIRESVSSNPNWNTKYTLEFYKFETLQDLIQQIKPFLFLKRRHAELLLEFIKLRMHSLRDNPRWRKIETNPKTGRILTSHPIPYSDREMEIYQEVSRLNQKGREKKP